MTLTFVFYNYYRSRKIVLQCKDAAQMTELANHAEKEKLPYTVIQDAGYTQIPSGSQTVLAIFGIVKDVDKVTGQLKLLP
jgi:PTH2 family peptidyl-tRNA hydrolase